MSNPLMVLMRPGASRGTISAACGPRGRRVEFLLGLIAGASLVLYLVLLRVLRDFSAAEPSFAGQVLPFVGVRSREDFPRIFPLASFQFLGLVWLLFGLYALAVVRSAGLRSHRLALAVWLAGSGFLAVQIFGTAMLSTDAYAYTLYGRIHSLYHGDPYVRLAGQYSDDPYLPLTYGLPWPSWYGPVWTAVSGWLAILAGERVGLAVLFFRLTAIASALLVGGLVYACLRLVKPEWALSGLIFVLWNPLFVLESGLSAHNDAFMAALLLLGFWLGLRNRPILAMVPFALSVLVKFVFGLVLPLFALLILRSLPTWRERARYLVFGGLTAAIVVGGAMWLGRVQGEIPVARAAAASASYENNIHELLFRRLRQVLGEAPESAATPVHFYRWWAGLTNSTSLWSAPDARATVVERLRAGEAVLVLSPGGSRRFWVYNPASGSEGYVDRSSIEKIDRPDWVNHLPDVWPYEANPSIGPQASQANTLLRVVCWTIFAVLWVTQAWRVRDWPSWLLAQAVIMTSALWLVATETWPWYANWALVLAALVPTSKVALLIGLLTATVPSLYVSLGFQNTAWEWVYTYRSLSAFALPLLLFTLIIAGKMAWSRLQARPDSGITSGSPVSQQLVGQD